MTPFWPLCMKSELPRKWNFNYLPMCLCECVGECWRVCVCACVWSLNDSLAWVLCLADWPGCRQDAHILPARLPGECRANYMQRHVACGIWLIRTFCHGLCNGGTGLGRVRNCMLHSLGQSFCCVEGSQRWLHLYIYQVRARRLLLLVRQPQFILDSPWVCVCVQVVCCLPAKRVSRAKLGFN